MTGEVSSTKKDDDRYWHCGNSQIQLDVAVTTDDDDELYGKAEEEEKVELQQGNVDLLCVSAPYISCGLFFFLGGGRVSLSAYLIMEKSLLHPVISTDLLENIPSKHLIQLPGYP